MTVASDLAAFLSVEELQQILPDLIAGALAAKDSRAVLPAGTATIGMGMVQSATGAVAQIQLDEDEPGVLTSAQLATTVAVGDRVPVFFTDNGGALVVGGGGPGGPTVGGTGFDVHWTAVGRAIGATYTASYVFGAATNVRGLFLYADVLPTGVRQCIVDLFVNDVSVWSADPSQRATLTATSGNPLETTLATALPVVSGDRVKAYIANAGGAEGLFIGVMLG